jgi:hypothetical protein
MIAAHAHLFPEWEYQPGITSPDACEAILKAAGLQVTATWPATVGDAVTQFAEANTVGGMVFTAKFYDDPPRRQSLSAINHILRLTVADQNGIEVMNPYRCPSQAALEKYTWLEFASFQARIAIFKK